MECPKCQYDNREEAKFCNECGFNLNDVTEIPSETYNKPKSYTPKHLADKILKSKSSIIGEKKLVTVLFADVANYTSMSEKLDAEAVHQIMDGCFKILMDEIHNHHGTINQFTGDGVMALFGAPLALEDHAQDACRAALSIQKSMKAYSMVLEGKHNINFQMRIGINSGSVVVGSIGDDLRMDYTAVGDTTNLAARMESKANPGTVLVSPNTYRKVSQQFEFRSLGETEVKGKEEPLEIYELIKDKVYRPRLGQERQIYSEMVGRDDQLNELEIQILKAIKGEGSVVNIIGEAGIGKSRLISELRKSPTIKKVTLLEGRAISIGRNLSFHPIIDLIKHWARISEDDSEASSLSKLETAIRSVSQQDADEIIPFVATLMGMKLTGRYAKRVEGIEGEALEKLILKNVKDLITKATEITPLVMVIEDLHWADDSSVELLESLFRLAETNRILFINVFRPYHKDTGDRIVQTIKERLSVYCVEINLEPLSEKMSETLIDKMLEIKGIPHGIKSRIIQRSGGNPFFIEEVVRSFIDTGAVVIKDAKFEVTDKIDKIIIPHTVNDVLMARIDRLEDETRDLVKVASVIGRNFFHKILSEVAESIENIDSKISHLKDIQLIRERKRMEELEYLFKHALAQEAAYESILHQKRKEIHLQVARSIENVFKEKLHEFYGMLALHYSKAEDYDSAERYLVKAGEEALRSSASSEALNYYQEGLKLYLQSNKDKPNPEKLGMLEKNIAIALYNKSNWMEAVQHIDKVFEHWNISAYPNRLVVLLKFIKNAILFMVGFDRFFTLPKRPLNQRDDDVFSLTFKKSSAFVFFDNLKFFFSTLNGFNNLVSRDISNSQRAVEFFIGSAAVFAASGLSFKLAQKIVEKGETLLGDNIQNRITYTEMLAAINHCSGKWSDIHSLEEELLDNALRTGILWSVSDYIFWFGFIKTRTGDFSDSEKVISKLKEMADLYDWDHATAVGYHLKIDLLLKRFQAIDAKIESEKGINFAIQTRSIVHQIIFTAYRAEACILLNDMQGAEESIRQTKEMVNEQKFLIPILKSQYLISLFMTNIQTIKNAMKLENKVNNAALNKKALESGKRAVRGQKKYAPYQTRVLRLMGDYHYLIGKQNKAFKWWNKAIKKGEQLGARPDLSCTYFEIGKALLDHKCNYKEWNGMSAQEYLNKARTMFKEMDLQYHLDELDKIASSN
jgi:class 3 adenylate cyclase